MSKTLYGRDAAGLRRVVDRFAGAEVLGLDTEFITERSYHPRLCLLQLSECGADAVVDPLSCSDLRPLRRLFEAGACLVVHAGEQDLAILARHVGIVPERVLDTQIAAAFLGHGHSVSYARLVESCLGVRLRRSQAYTDWSRRPLDPEQLEYAIEDVRYLLPLHDHLVGRLAERGRLEWVREECDRARRRALEVPDPRQQWRRVSRARRLEGLRLAILQELAAWREREADRRDRPRGHVLPDRVLVEIARRAPRDVTVLRKLRGLNEREAARSGRAIIEAVGRARSRPAASWPTWPQPSRRARDTRVDAVTTLLDALLRARAQRLDLASRMISNREDLERLVVGWLDGSLATDGGGDSEGGGARAGSEGDGTREGAGRTGKEGGDDSDRRLGPRVLRGWRRQVIGDELLRLLRGELRLGVGQEGVELFPD